MRVNNLRYASAREQAKRKDFLCLLLALQAAGHVVVELLPTGERVGTVGFVTGALFELGHRAPAWVGEDAFVEGLAVAGHEFEDGGSGRDRFLADGADGSGSEVFPAVAPALSVFHGEVFDVVATSVADGVG